MQNRIPSLSLSARLRRGAVAVVASAALLTHSGCSLFVPNQQPVRITASDPQAAILVDGEHVGTGSAAVQLTRNRSHTVLAQTGSRQGATVINKRLSSTGVLDLVGGCFFLVPFLGIAGGGFWQLEPDEVAVIIPGEGTQEAQQSPAATPDAMPAAAPGAPIGTDATVEPTQTRWQKVWGR